MKTFDCSFIEADSTVLLQLRNASAFTLRSVEILTVFLKVDSNPAVPSQAHIRFDPVNTIRPEENVVIPHKTWIDGKPVEVERDQLARLRPMNGTVKPYVLDISWLEPGGKTCFQRIPVGH